MKNKDSSPLLLIKLLINLSSIPLLFVYFSQLANPTFWVTLPFMIVSIYMIFTSYRWFEGAFENVFIQEDNRTLIDSSYFISDFFKKHPKFNLFWTSITFFCWIYWFFSTFQALASLLS